MLRILVIKCLLVLFEIDQREMTTSFYVELPYRHRLIIRHWDTPFEPASKKG